MEELPWFWIWIVAAAVLFIGEMLSLSFFLLPFAIGAVVAAICNALGLELVWQIIVFIVVSAVSLAALRPFARRITKKASGAKAGAERLVGMKGAVIEGQSATRDFRVKVDGEPWNASAASGATLVPGTPIEVLAVNSNSLVVEALPQKDQSDSYREPLASEQTQKGVKDPLEAPHFVDVDESRKKSSNEQ
ncbi:MAG: NfeD family protein [Coriobacteriia bacterium]|nr:NfeD family protein [Coriobacteriia bacterium]